MKLHIPVYFTRYLIHILAFTALVGTGFFLIMVDVTQIKLTYKYHKQENHSIIEWKKNVLSNVSSPNNGRNGTKLILVWSPLFSGWNFLTSGTTYFQTFGCLESRCEITSDRNRLLDSDAILFHVRSLSLADVPGQRRHDQVWIFFSLEAPPYTQFQGLDFMHGMFNWTMTYRQDSDVVVPYGIVTSGGKHWTNKIGGKTLDEQELFQEWKNKSKMAVWMSSHCTTHGNREDYVQKLMNYIDVVTFGECGMAVCPFQKTKKCLENFSRHFYFYLAFENAVCVDYITEKFYRVLEHNLIPVVFGGGNYASIAPNNSFISVEDFSSPQELSSHLLRVASNFTLYAEYFRWKLEGYKVQSIPQPCDLCKKLHSSYVPKIYNNINKWWTTESHCITFNSI